MKETNLYSWNVNGLRSVHTKGFLDFVKKQNPDMLCLQEIKADMSKIPDELQNIDGYHAFFHPAERKGYSGTALYSKAKPRSVKYDIGMQEHDGEGRVLTADFDNFYLVNVYTPNSKRDLSRLKYRQKWDRDFMDFLKDLEKDKPVIFCGDLNVAHKEIDLKNPRENRRNAGFTDEEREGISHTFDSGFLDTFRLFNQEPENYTWWSYMNRARERNIGWRIDYFCASQSLKNRIKNASILPHIHGSDHCPVSLSLLA